MKKILWLLLILTLSTPAHSDKKATILVTIYPLASLVKMLVDPMAEVDVLQQSASCPHHFMLAPSMIENIKKANYLILIDRKFEVYLSNYLTLTQANIVEVADLIGFDSKVNNNFHFWVNRDYIKQILAALRDYFIAQEFNKDEILKNYTEALKRISEGQNNKLGSALFIGEGCKYLSTQSDYIEKIYGLRGYRELNNLIKTKKYKCIISDASSKINSVPGDYKKIILDIEDWDIGDVDLEDYIIEYLENINQKLETCY
ncbi:MAG: hypothetical protein EB127_14680 [Alphaproteobacteria bacterium]|nr:hypothetical protein [Alphaproteobacteria bacterium]